MNRSTVYGISGNYDRVNFLTGGDMKLSNEARVGLLVTVSFTLFILTVAVLSNISVSRSGYTIHLYFSFLNDLRAGAPVKIGGGIKIGDVKEIVQSEEKTEVIVWIDNKYKLPKATSFAIFTTGLIGEKYINVIVPAMKSDEGFIADGEIRYGIDPASFDRMMQTFQSFMQDKDGGEILANIFKNSNKFVGNLNNVVDENRYDLKRTMLMAKGMVSDLSLQTNTLMTQLNILSKNAAELSEKNKEDISITLKNLSETTSSLNKITYRLENGRGTLGKLLTDEEVYNNLRDASVYARDLFKQLQKDPSNLFYGTKK
jgi:phospholipid/cholesterol/gamma-HCH transport system substrate-binding protein